ncbi:hypothetical protein DMJ13_23145 [halophilic archaeon]|nr:hypothetical protein DMJ13_23145 [halophilic archaeon]
MTTFRYTDTAIFILLATVWGTVYIVVKAVLPYISYVVLAALRYDLAGVVMLSYTVVATHSCYYLSCQNLHDE